MAGIKTIFGAGSVNKGRAFGEPGALDQVYALMKENNCSTIDTAALYGDSEELLGKAQAGSKFTLDTKTKGGFGGKGYATKEKVVEEGTNSMNLIGKVDVYYLHAPDADTPIESTFAGFEEMYKKGFFKRLGLSNVKPADVQKIYDLCKSKGWPVPEVYQGEMIYLASRREVNVDLVCRKLLRRSSKARR